MGQVFQEPIQQMRNMTAFPAPVNHDPLTLMIKNVPRHITEPVFRDMLINDPQNGVWACNANRRRLGNTSEVIVGQYFVNFVKIDYVDVALKEWRTRPFFAGVQLHVEPKTLRLGQSATSPSPHDFTVWWEKLQRWEKAQRASAPDFDFVPRPQVPRNPSAHVEPPASAPAFSTAIKYPTSSIPASCSAVIRTPIDANPASSTIIKGSNGRVTLPPIKTPTLRDAQRTRSLPELASSSNIWTALSQQSPYSVLGMGPLSSPEDSPLQAKAIFPYILAPASPPEWEDWYTLCDRTKGPYGGISAAVASLHAPDAAPFQTSIMVTTIEAAAPQMDWEWSETTHWNRERCPEGGIEALMAALQRLQHQHDCRLVSTCSK